MITTYQTRKITTFYGSSCANNGKGALNTPDKISDSYKTRVDAKRRMHRGVDCMTLHACAKRRCAVLQGVVGSADDRVHEKFIREVIDARRMMEELSWPPDTPPKQVRIYPQRAPIAKVKREYTHNGHQSQKGRENIAMYL
eukprot:3620190-Pyramimonas_sp.AAC.1